MVGESGIVAVIFMRPTVAQEEDENGLTFFVADLNPLS